MDFTVIAAFLLLVVPTFVTPGPNNLMLMTSAAKFGLTPTIPHAMGIVLGFPLMVFLVGLGLGEVFAALPGLQSVLKYFAAAYFLWLSYRLLGLKIGAVTGVARPMRFIEAALFQWVNPKAWVMSTSFVVAFVVPGEGRILSLLLVTLGCILIAPFSSLLWMVSGQQLKSFLTKTDGEKYLGAILAILMLVAVVLFLI
jgi:threonine/homoserine/homoserine lactone efflux protein